MKIILSESQAGLLRRLWFFDEVMKEKFDEIYPSDKLKELCKHYGNENNFIDAIFYYLWEKFFYRFWRDLDNIDTEKNYDIAFEYFEKKYGDMVRQRWRESCQLSESILSESKSLTSFQNLINDAISEFKNICNTQNSEDDEYISFYACDLINSDLKVTLKEVKMAPKIITLLLDISYSNYQFFDEDPFVYELQDYIKKLTGKNIKVIVYEYRNTFPQEKRQW